jgi:hypothetical protein
MFCFWRREHQYSCVRRLVGPQSWSGCRGQRKKKSFACARGLTQFVQSIVRDIIILYLTLLLHGLFIIN